MWTKRAGDGRIPVIKTVPFERISVALYSYKRSIFPTTLADLSQFSRDADVVRTSQPALIQSTNTNIRKQINAYVIIGTLKIFSMQCDLDKNDEYPYEGSTPIITQ